MKPVILAFEHIEAQQNLGAGNHSSDYYYDQQRQDTVCGFGEEPAESVKINKKEQNNTAGNQMACGEIRLILRRKVTFAKVISD